MKCKICGAEIPENEFTKQKTDELVEHQMCFTCNHWRINHEEDINNCDPHEYAIVDGGHYRLLPSDPNQDGWFKGFGGHRFHFKFNDGTEVECDNVWFQGDITEAHPYWRDLMPDNAVIIHNK